MNYNILHLDSDEHVILEVRKHWIVFVGYAVSLLVMAVLPCALFLLVKIFLPKILPFISFPGNVSAYFLFFLLTLVAFSLDFFFRAMDEISSGCLVCNGEAHH